jgi:Glycosyltransferase family 87
MPPDTEADAPADVTWQRLAVGFWLAAVVAVCVRGAVQPRSHSLYPTYANAAAHWRGGADLYPHGPLEPGLEPYRYSPLVAASLVPFGLLPDEAGSVLWRLVNAAVLLAGLAAWLRSPLPWKPGKRQRALVYLLVLPLALAGLNNGQTNPLMVGFLLLTVAAAGDGRWNAAALCTALATALKIYPLALGLLLAAAYPRRFAGRLLLAIAVVAALPFLFQRPSYVAGQYAEWLRMLIGDDRKFWPVHVAYRDLWLLFRLTGTPMDPRVYLAIQMLSGAACAALCVAGRLRGWDPATVLTAALVLGTCWMTLCGPATESNTYVLLAPALARGLLAARVEGWPRPERWLPSASTGLLAIGLLAGLTQWTARIHALGMQPLAALLLFAAFLAVYVRLLLTGVTRADTGTVGPTARAA